MQSTSGDLLTMALVAMFTAALVITVSHLVSWRRSRIPRLRLLTGTRSQQAAIVLAVRPVVRELLPGLGRVGAQQLRRDDHDRLDAAVDAALEPHQEAVPLGERLREPS